jgi:hypothetical protein
MVKYLFLLFILPLHAFAFDQTWKHSDSFEKKTTSHNLNLRHFNLSTELVDSDFRNNNGPDFYRGYLILPGTHKTVQAEIQGARTHGNKEFGEFSSFLKYRNEIFNFGNIKLSAQAQLSSVNKKTRPSVGIPMDYQFNKKFSAGFLTTVEHGEYRQEDKGLRKVVINAYLNHKLGNMISGGLGVYSEKLSLKGEERFSALNAHLFFHFIKNTRINIGSSASGTPENVILNHVLGASLIF